MEPSSDNFSPINYITGPCQIGNNILFSFLTGKNFDIQNNGRNFDIEIIGENSLKDISSKAAYYKDYCNLPCIFDSYGDINKLEGLLTCLQEIEKANKSRFILVFEEELVIASNSSQFYNYCSEIIQTIGLTPDCGIHLVITNSSQNFTERLPGLLQRRFPGEHHFLIEGIKSQSIKISSLDKPILQDNNYSFSEENRQRILRNIANTTSSRQNFRLSILSKIYELIEKLKYGSNTSDIKFVSDLPRNFYSYDDDMNLKSNKALIIDKDIDFRGEALIIDSPNIIIKVNQHEKRLITIRGKQPRITFTENLNLVINGEMLILTVLNEYDEEYFLDPKKEDFEKSCENIRLESICINSWFTEIMLHNNKFIDLIVYFKKKYGRITVDDRWNIKKVDCDIYVKLHINERMKTKSHIAEKYKSLRCCENVDEYLRVTNKDAFTDEYKIILENFIVNIPSIFQIFMTQSLFRKISSECREIEDLREIRKIFIKRYLNLLEDFSNEEKCKIEKSKHIKKGYEISRSFVERINCFGRKPFHKNSHLINELDNLLMRSLDDQHTSDFLIFYNHLITTNNKVELFIYMISGDLSIYPNYKGMVQVKRNDRINAKTEGISFLSAGTTILIGISILLLGFAVKKIPGTFFSKESTHLLTANNIMLSILLAIAIDIGANLAHASYKSGYYKNTIKIEGKNIRFDSK